MGEDVKELVERLTHLEVKSRYLDTLVSVLLSGMEKGYTKGEYRFYSDTEVCALIKLIAPGAFNLRVAELEKDKVKGED
jgi:radical SAM superfamily enzyme